MNFAGHSVRKAAGLTGLLLISALGLSACTPPAPAPVTTPADHSVVIRMLDTLTVAIPNPPVKYNRARFRIWDAQPGGCDTREVVIKRSGTGVITGAQCRIVSGTWVSPYDGRTFTVASQLDIDHLVPLGEAWVAGAWSWTDQQRESFANDLTDPQLLAVSASANREKGDKTPDKWKPALSSFWPTYATDWVMVKAKFKLSVTPTEKAALAAMLG
jgi:hypothetical protein